jgi:hypothetical protein
VKRLAGFCCTRLGWYIRACHSESVSLLIQLPDSLSRLTRNMAEYHFPN